MKRYEAYKDTGVEWIGEIPKDWKAVRLKYIVKSVGTGSTPPSDDIRYYQDGTISWYGPGDFKQLVLNSAKRKITQQAVIDRKSKLFPKGTIQLVGIGATVGKIGLVQEESSSNQQVNAIEISDENNSMFYTFFLSSIKEIIVSEAASATLPIFNQSNTKNLWVPLPSLKEQTLIANYLDHKTKQLDELIASKQKLIELLEEERTATINHAVTKGINPDAPLKDSGIEWLGEIPEHWEVKRLKYAVDLISDKTSEKPEYILALENIESWSGQIIGNPHSNKMIGDVLLFKVGEILFNKLRPYLAKVAFANKNGGAIGELLVFRAVSSVSNRFMYQLLRSEMIISIVDNSTYGAKMPRASWDKFISQIGIALPNEKEQIEIADYIEIEQLRVTKHREKLKQEIQLLQEYKTALISEVVTGKVDVREEVLD